MLEYHLVWLAAHPGRTEGWLKEKFRDGFHIHHIDGDHDNNAATNLLLIEASDHMLLHTGRLQAGIKLWRSSNGRRAAAALAKKRAAAKPLLASPGRRRTRPPAAERGSLLAPPVLAKARECIDGGGDVLEAARLVADMTDLSWKRLTSAVRREALLPRD